MQVLPFSFVFSLLLLSPPAPVPHCRRPKLECAFSCCIIPAGDVVVSFWDPTALVLVMLLRDWDTLKQTPVHQLSTFIIKHQVFLKATQGIFKNLLDTSGVTSGLL